MNRRSFLRSLVVGAAGAVVTSALPGGLDPERLLWTPGQKTFFIPEAPKLYQGSAVDWASGGDLSGVRGTFPTINLITQEALKVLEDQLALTRRCVNEAFYRDYAKGEFPIPQLEDTIELRKPPRFEIRLKVEATPELEESRQVLQDQFPAIRAELAQMQTLVNRIAEKHKNQIREAAVARAHEIRRKRINIFARMAMVPTPECESAVAVDERSKLTMRGIRFFDHIQNVHEVRFEVLGGRA